VTDFFDRVESELRSATVRRHAEASLPRRRRPRWNDLRVAACVAGALVVAVVTLVLLGHRPGTDVREPAPSVAAPTANPVTHPWLYALQQHLAVLRGQPPATTTAEARSLMQTYDTRYVRLGGSVAGMPIYFIVIPIRKDGRVASYMMRLTAGLGAYSFVPGYYDIQPQAIDSQDGIVAYFSVIPDGVSSVRWRFACPRGRLGANCRGIPTRSYTAHVHGNLAVLASSDFPFGTPSEYEPVRVTWRLDDGRRRVFRNPGNAIPWKGAPRRPTTTAKTHRKHQPNDARGHRGKNR
jgi:hypothetical protein